MEVPEVKQEVKQVEEAVARRPTVSPEEEAIRKELESLFLDLLASAQKLSYELATLEMKENYAREELKDLLDAARDVVGNVKRMHRFLERHAKRR